MQKTILITGSTDGIGLEAAKVFYAQGHQVLLHGRNEEKLQTAINTLEALNSQRNVNSQGNVKGYLADLSLSDDVKTLAKTISDQYSHLDVLINNAGVLKVANHFTRDGLDLRFAVNTIAPYLLTQKLLPRLNAGARVINLSSAAQAPVDINLLLGKQTVDDDLAVYAQSKLALTIWSNQMAQVHKNLVFIALNPGSLLATKMVKEGFNMAGKDINIGVDIMVRAALGDEFAKASGQYYDNDTKGFASPHPDVLDTQKCQQIMQTIEAITGINNF